MSWSKTRTNRENGLSQPCQREGKSGLDSLGPGLGLIKVGAARTPSWAPVARTPALLALARTPGPPLSRRLLPPCLLLAPRSVTPWVEGPQSLLARLRLALALVDVRGTEGTSHWPA